jgi:hypothetical protein
MKELKKTKTINQFKKGLIMQPVVGVLSDGCKSKWGRRRPFLLGGSIVVVLSLLAIGWTREITSLFTSSESGDAVIFSERNSYKLFTLIILHNSLKLYR